MVHCSLTDRERLVQKADKFGVVFPFHLISYAKTKKKIQNEDKQVHGRKRLG